MPSHSYWFHQSMIIYADMRVRSINHCRNIRTFIKSDVVALSDYQYRISKPLLTCAIILRVSACIGMYPWVGLNTQLLPGNKKKIEHKTIG